MPRRLQVRWRRRQRVAVHMRLWVLVVFGWELLLHRIDGNVHKMCAQCNMRKPRPIKCARQRFNFIAKPSSEPQSFPFSINYKPCRGTPTDL